MKHALLSDRGLASRHLRLFMTQYTKRMRNHFVEFGHIMADIGLHGALDCFTLRLKTWQELE
jgi:hypothetical protein